MLLDSADGLWVSQSVHKHHWHSWNIHKHIKQLSSTVIVEIVLFVPDDFSSID